MNRVKLFFISTALITTCDSKTCPRGQEITHFGVSNDSINTIMYYHLKYRNNAMEGIIPKQPAANFMEVMQWDSKLAMAAQKIADTCMFQITEVVDDRWSHVGQNIIVSSWQYEAPDNWEEIIEKWFSEHDDYMYFKGDQQSLNYQQIVWANTTHIGCGFVEYKTIDPALSYQSLYVCNYGPAGNIPGELPYNTDEDDSKQEYH